MKPVASALLIGSSLVSLLAQPQRLTLDEAEAIGLKNHPAIAATKLDALAVHERIDQARSARFPFVTASATAVGAQDDSRIAAGALNNPIIYSRFATGFSINQMLIDFGRTSRLVASSRSAAGASDQRSDATRADVILAVRRTYFNALRAESLLRVAKATVDSRQVVADQVTELVKAQLKSSLDQSFAETNLAEARLLAASAENERLSAYADLAQALGRQSIDPLELVEEPEPAVEPLALSELRNRALQQRPELKAAKLELDAARQFASAERALRFPSVAGTMGAGYVPKAVTNLSSDYAAIGLNVSLPFLNGGLYKARQAEAEFRSRAIDRRINDLENQISRDVSTAWLDVNTASERIRLTRQLRPIRRSSSPRRATILDSARLSSSARRNSAKQTPTFSSQPQSTITRSAGRCWNTGPADCSQAFSTLSPVNRSPRRENFDARKIASIAGCIASEQRESTDRGVCADIKIRQRRVSLTSSPPVL